MIRRLRIGCLVVALVPIVALGCLGCLVIGWEVVTHLLNRYLGWTP